MGRPTLENTRDMKEELSLVAMEMIQTRGYNAFSYQDLASRLKIQKASIHYHFPTKEALGIALIEWAVEKISVWHLKLRNQNLSPLQELEAFFDYFTRLSAGGTKICPCGALSSEWEGLPPKVRKAVSKLMNVHEDWLVDVIERGQKVGEFSRSGTSTEQAKFVFASVQGGLQLARAQGGPQDFRAIAKQTLSALRA